MSNADFQAGRVAEREAIRLALIGCDDCGEVHESHTCTSAASCPCGHGGKSTYTSWASLKDGHAYAPKYVRFQGSVGDLVRQVTQGG